MDIETLKRAMPIVPHELAGVDCCGCISVRAGQGSQAELYCNECGVVVGSVDQQILVALLGLEAALQRCPHCGQVNVFPELELVLAYTCQHCGQVVELPEGPVQ